MTFSLRSSLSSGHRRPVAPAASYVVAGKIDRRVVMQRAVNYAFQSLSSGRPWRMLMSECLRLAWSRAPAKTSSRSSAPSSSTLTSWNTG